MNSGWTQNPNLDYKYSIKLNNLSMIEEFEMICSRPEIPTAGDSFFNYKNTKILNPTISLQLKSKWNNFHELEFTTISFDKREFKESYYNQEYEIIVPRNGSNQTKLNFALRYEYNYLFNKKEERKIVPSIGFGINPYYYQLVTEPILSTSWKTSEKLFAISFQVIPRIAYFISSKFFIDINVPVSIFDYKYLHYYVDNPIIFEELKTSNSQKTSFFPKTYCGRIGIGYKF